MKTNPLPQKTPDEDGLDQIREMAHEMMMSYHFHEVAIENPFTAETELQEYGRRLMEIVGWPKGWVQYE